MSSVTGLAATIALGDPQCERKGERRCVAIIKTTSNDSRKQVMQPPFQADFPPPHLLDATLSSDHRVSWADAVQPPDPKDKKQNTNSSKEQNPLGLEECWKRNQAS